MNEATEKHEGGCYCSLVRYQINGLPVWSGHCHCRSCQMALGGAFLTWAKVAAEDFVVALHAAERATLVGEKTAGTTGQPLIIDLPGGSARICTKWDTYPDGRDFVGVGVIPDVEVRPTQAALAAGTDIVLEKGLEVLGNLGGT